MAHLKPQVGHVDYWDSSLPTFGVRVSPSGTKTFILKHRNSRRSLGRYPVISLADARTEAKHILAEFTLGKVRPGSVTYERAVQQFIEDKKRSKRKSTAEGYEWLLARLKLHGRLQDISHHEISSGLSRIKSRSTYDHALVAARIFFNWCLKRRYVSDNPTIGISPHGTPRRKRILTPTELKAIWEVCDDQDNALPAAYRNIVQLLIVTGQRRGEIAAFKTSYLEADIATLPSELTKNHRQHVFPLPQIALDIISRVQLTSQANDAFFFPARGKSDKPFNGWSKSKTILDKLSGVNGYTLHDLRRTFRSKLGALGVQPHIAERLVNHISSRTEMEETYDLWSYLPEMRVAMRSHEEWLRSTLAIEPPRKAA